MNKIACAALLLLGTSTSLAADEKLTPKQSSYTYKTVGERQLRIDVTYPDDWQPTDHRPGMVFFSGGGFRNGGTQQFTTQSEYFAKRGLVTVRAEYRDRTRDNATVFVCLEDALSAMRFVRKHAPELGIDANRIVASGGSAGGFLASAVAKNRDYPVPDGQSISPVPNALVLFNPVVDLASTDRGELGPEKEKLKQISPAHHLTSDYPPTVILIGSEDSFMPQIQKFVEDAKKLGVRVEIDIAPDQPHAFFNRDPWTGKTAGRADQFLQSLGYLKAEPAIDLPKARKQESAGKEQPRGKAKAKRGA